MVLGGKRAGYISRNRSAVATTSTGTADADTYGSTAASGPGNGVGNSKSAIAAATAKALHQDCIRRTAVGDNIALYRGCDVISITAIAAGSADTHGHRATACTCTGNSVVNIKTAVTTATTDTLDNSSSGPSTRGFHIALDIGIHSRRVTAAASCSSDTHGHCATAASGPGNGIGNVKPAIAATTAKALHQDSYRILSFSFLFTCQLRLHCRSVTAITAGAADTYGHRTTTGACA